MVTIAAGASTAPSGIGVRDTPTLPDRIGRYRIQRLIGSGGMGAVYEALQEQPHRTVALKVIRGALASPEIVKRFEYESELLARLRHPCIAQVFEAGTHLDAATGQQVPFYAMEYIPEASELVDHADKKALDLRQRLELFVQVCDAVHHGHQRGIIHRDLKPANVLVDSNNCPKIIDFGVAMSAEDTSRGDRHTTAGELVGTLQYMSPEQCSGDGARDSDVRTDVYALGVILYELLTGNRPYSIEGCSLAEAVKAIVETPPRPPAQHRPELRGDVETIILKSLEKDRDRRYGTASELAEDIGRYLRFEPILARPIGAAGRLARWVRRNRTVAAVGSTSLAILLVLSVTLVTKIVIESRRANENLKAAEKNFELVRELFASMRPDNLQQGLVDVGQILDAAAERMERTTIELPATEASFREILGEAYRGLSQYEQSIRHHRRVVELRERLLKPTDPRLAESLHQLAAALWWNGEYDEALPLYQRALEMRRKHYGEEHEAVAMSMTHLAACLLKQGRLDDAEEYYTRALMMRRKLFGDRSPQVAASCNNLAKCLWERGDVMQAEALFRTALAMIIETAGHNNLNTASAAYNMGSFLAEIGRYTQARDMFERALKVRTERFRPDHDMVLWAKLGRDRAISMDTPDGELIASVASIVDTIEARKPGHPDVAEAHTALGIMHMRAHNPASAEHHLLRAIEVLGVGREMNHRDLGMLKLRLGECWRLLCRFDDAACIIEESRFHFRRSFASPLLFSELQQALDRVAESRAMSASAMH